MSNKYLCRRGFRFIVGLIIKFSERREKGLHYPYCLRTGRQAVVGTVIFVIAKILHIFSCAIFCQVSLVFTTQVADDNDPNERSKYRTGENDDKQKDAV